MKKIDRKIKEKIKNVLFKEVYNNFDINPKTKYIYHLTLDQNQMRLDFKRRGVDINSFKEEARLQMVAYNNGVKVPKVLFIDNEIKISQWIDGVEMHDVRNEPEPNIQLGKLIGKLNSTQDGGKYLALADLTNKNSIWTGKELFFIDFCDLVVVDYEEAIKRASMGVGAWIHLSRWEWFIEGYLHYHPDINVNNFIEQANKEKQRKVEKKRRKKKINELRPWYQSIEVDDIRTTHKETSSIKLWDNIRSVLPKNLEGKRILDLGANAGHYSIQSALLGAKVISVEISKLAHSQFLFIKECFENIHNRDLDIEYIQENINDLDFDKLGNFDYIFALAILYHLDTYKYDKDAVKTFPNQNRVITKLTEKSDNIIIRTRKGNIMSYKIFKKLNFKSKLINTTGDRDLIIYSKKGDI